MGMEKIHPELLLTKEKCTIILVSDKVNFIEGNVKGC